MYKVSVDFHHLKGLFKVFWMALDAKLVFTEKHMPPLQEGQFISSFLQYL